MGIRPWHAVLAPLGVTVGVRRLAPDGAWRLRETRLPDYVPLLAAAPSVGDAPREWKPIGQVLAVGAGHGYLMAFGVVVGAADGPVEAMIDGRLRPEFDLDHAAMQIVDAGGGDLGGLFHGGTVSRIYAGELPAWDGARFTVGDELARPDDAGAPTVESRGRP